MKLTKKKVLLAILSGIILCISYFIACLFYFYEFRTFTIANFSDEDLQVEVFKGSSLLFDIPIDKMYTENIKVRVNRNIPYIVKVKGQTFEISEENITYDEGSPVYSTEYYYAIFYIIITENKKVIFETLKTPYHKKNNVNII